MNRTVRQGILLLAALGASELAATAQEAAPAKNKPETSQQERKGGTGIVPLGVKLAPQMPPAGAPKTFHFPEAATKTLPNGLRVFVVTDRREPAIAVRLLLPTAGSIEDPEKLPGIARMTAALLTQGTEKRSARQIAEAIDFVGGSLNTTAGKDSTSVTLSVVKKDLPLGLDLMSDIVLHPAFQPEELDRQRQQLLSNLVVQYSDPDYLASVVFNRVVFTGSPYGWPGEGTPVSVEKFQRDAFVRFHDATYVPNHALLAFAGDISPEDAFAAAEKYLGAWARKDVQIAPPSAPAAISGLHVWLIDKPDAVQTQIRIGRLGIRRNDPDYIPLVVANRIFGGGYNSRLNTEVRIKKGLTYGAFSSFDSRRFTGSFVLGTFTRTQVTVEAVKLATELVSKMSTGVVTPAEMDFARDYLAGVYPIQSETADQVADRVLTVAFYGLPADYNSTYPERIRAVTSGQVKAVAERFFGAKDLDIVLAGNVAAFRESLKKEMPDAQFTEIPLDQLELLSPDLRKPKEVTLAPTPESLEQAKAILLDAAKAAGGDSLLSVRGLGMTEVGTILTPRGEEHTHVKWAVAYPDKSRGEISFPGQVILQVCDGKSAWLSYGQRSMEVSSVLGEFERGISLFGGGWGLLQRVLAGEISGQALGEEEIEGVKARAVAVDAPFGSLKLYFDPATHLIAAARYKSSTKYGPVESEQRWLDYRPVEGRQFAFQTVVYRNGTKFAETKIEEVNLNPKIDPTLFEKPASSAPSH